jgi:hypothetical protein
VATFHHGVHLCGTLGVPRVPASCHGRKKLVLGMSFMIQMVSGHRDERDEIGERVRWPTDFTIEIWWLCDQRNSWCWKMVVKNGISWWFSMVVYWKLMWYGNIMGYTPIDNFFCPVRKTGDGAPTWKLHLNRGNSFGVSPVLRENHMAKLTKALEGHVGCFWDLNR